MDYKIYSILKILKIYSKILKISFFIRNHHLKKLLFQLFELNEKAGKSIDKENLALFFLKNSIFQLFNELDTERNVKKWEKIASKEKL